MDENERYTMNYSRFMKIQIAWCYKDNSFDIKEEYLELVNHIHEPLKIVVSVLFYKFNACPFVASSSFMFHISCSSVVSCCKINV